MKGVRNVVEVVVEQFGVDRGELNGERLHPAKPHTYSAVLPCRAFQLIRIAIELPGLSGLEGFELPLGTV